MVAILAGAALVSGLVGDVGDSIAIGAILALNVLLGFFQEYRAERAISRLRELSVPAVRVRRDGEIREIPAAKLVPGDLYLFDAGNILPADGRLLSGTGVLVDEAILTGESQAAPKLPGTDTAFAGSTVLKGKGTVEVSATGTRTELGKIAVLLKATPRPQTPLQKQLDRMSSRLALFVGAIALTYFIAGLAAGQPSRLMFLTAVSMAVAALPEGLPAVVTIVLAAAGQRMLRRNVLVRRLTAIEALGSVTVICSDKTGTLTENHMTLSEVWPASARRSVLDYGALCNDATLAGNAKWFGDPLDVALCEAAAAEGRGKTDLDNLTPRLASFPFDSERMAMTTVHRADGRSRETLEIAKGAPEALTAMCTLDDAARREIARTVERFAQSGLRVLAVAFRRHAGEEEVKSPSPEGLTFAGLVGFYDPPRADSAAALAACRRAGMRVTMLTGDHPLTARTVAEKLGFAAGSTVLTGAELSRLSPPELAEAVERVSIYARLKPEQKLTIVQALQSRGQIVAVTGDGVNDAPCLKTADLGIAMGEGGTDVARESAGIVLRDNSFASIVAAVREGRVIFANIQRFVRYLFIGNSGELAVMIVAPLLGMSLPLSPLQILWINLVTDGLPALALGVAPPERDVMTQPPRAPGQAIVDASMARSIVLNGLLLGGTSLAAGILCRRVWPADWQTVIFLVLGLSQLFLALGLNSATAPPLSGGFLANRAVVGAVLLCGALQWATIQWAPLRSALHTAVLSAPEVAMCFAFSAVPLLSVEIARRKAQSREEPAR